MKSKKNKTPKYIRKIQKKLENVELPPGIHHVHVLHEEWCDLLNGRGPCNCNAEVEFLGREN
jgi:hypothetical protein